MRDATSEHPCTKDTPCAKCRFMAHTRRLVQLYAMCVPADEALVTGTGGTARESAARAAAAAPVGLDGRSGQLSRLRAGQGRTTFARACPSGDSGECP
jgi:hypothetical protein